MRTVFVAVLALMIAAPAVATAQAPPKSISGVKVTWPKQTHVAPGTKLTVKVQSSKRRAQLAFVTATPGTKRVALARRTLRNGTFTVTVPAVAAATYLLRITVAGRRYSSVITTPGAKLPGPPEIPTVAPTPTPTPTPGPLALCTGPILPFAAEVTLAATTVRAGDPLDYALVNTGQAQVRVEQERRLLTEDRRGSVTLPGAGPAVVLQAGEQATRQAVIPADTAPGRYRIHQFVTHAQCDMVGTGPVESPVFEVTS